MWSVGTHNLGSRSLTETQNARNEPVKDKVCTIMQSVCDQVIILLKLDSTRVEGGQPCEQARFITFLERPAIYYVLRAFLVWRGKGNLTLNITDSFIII